MSGQEQSSDRVEAIRARAQGIWEREGRPDGKDLDHWRQAEQEIAGERRFRLVVEAAPNAMVMVDRAGRIVMVNAQAERVFGYARAELLEQPAELLVPGRFRGRHPGLREAFLAEPQARPMGASRDLYGLKKDGREFPVEIGLNPFETENGTMVLASVIDITERKTAELALRQSEHRCRSLAAIVESSDDAIISIGLNGLITSWNKTAERMFGYSEGELIGQPIVKLAAPGYEAEMMNILGRIQRGERVDHYETMRQHKNGSLLHVSLTESPIYDADGQLTGASKGFRDITVAKAAEAALQESQARLQELHSELLHMSRLSAMGQMAAMITHELNQPLTAITNYMEAGAAILDPGGEVPVARVRSIMERAGEQALRAGQIIQRLRSFISRGESEKRIEAIPPLLREAVELAVMGMKQRGVAIGIRPDVPNVKILADKIQIQQVLLNLLRNAVEAVSNQADKNVQLIVDAEENAVYISVVDNGPGLPEEVKARLFEPFVSTKQTGMGVGLSICNSIVTAHRGRLWAEPNRGGGTIFRMTLPLAPGGDTEASE
jgi:two-component system sensor kinase FixL